MSKTLTPEDIKAISQELKSVIEKCLKNIDKMKTTRADELMNIDEVSEKMKLGKQSVYRLIKEGQIKSIKIGKSLFVSVEDFNNYIKSKY